MWLRRFDHTLVPKFESHQYLYVYKYMDHTGFCRGHCQEVSRCRTRGESEESISPRGGRTGTMDQSCPWNQVDITRNLKQEYKWTT